jgi:hypothetical protein
VLTALRSAPSVASAGLLSTSQDGATDTSPEALPAGTYNYQVEGAAGVDVRAGLASAIVGSGNQLLELRVYRPSLEDVFISVISQDEQATADEEYGDEDGYEDGGDDGVVEDPDAMDVDSAEVAAEPQGRVRTRRRVRG